MASKFFILDQCQKGHTFTNVTECACLVKDTVKSFNFMGTKFRGLTSIDMFVDTWIRGFQIIHNSARAKKYFIGI